MPSTTLCQPWTATSTVLGGCEGSSGMYYSSWGHEGNRPLSAHAARVLTGSKKKAPTAGFIFGAPFLLFLANCAIKRLIRNILESKVAVSKFQ